MSKNNQNGFKNQMSEGNENSFFDNIKECASVTASDGTHTIQCLTIIV